MSVGPLNSVKGPTEERLIQMNHHDLQRSAPERLRANEVRFLLLTKMLTVGFIALVAVLLSSAPAAAQGASGKKESAAPAAPSPDSDKVDVSDLERKYWASKDTDFSVVQNRLYSKAGRFALSAQYGNLINDPWSDGPGFSGSLAYYFSERLGLEGHYQVINSVDNEATKSLKQNQGGAPNHSKLVGYQGVSLNWVPFYAKMSVLNSQIIYFDMAISPGLGVTQYEQQRVTGSHVGQSAPTFSLDVTQSFFFSKYFAFRVDFRNRWFQEEKIRFQTGEKIGTDLSQTSQLLFGLTFFY